MNERLVLPATFDCTRLRARVTEGGCARMWRSAHAADAAPKPWESRAACIGCAIGAVHAGEGLEVAREAARTQQVAGVCVRCGAGGRRMVKQTHCVSCYNRLREATIGKDARGRQPKHSARLFAVRLVVGGSGAFTARVCHGVTSRGEAILTAARQNAGAALSIGWQRLAELPIASQPELHLEAPRVPRPRARASPSCPVSIFLPELFHAAA